MEDNIEKKTTILLILGKLPLHQMKIIEGKFKVVTYDQFIKDREKYGAEIMSIIYSPYNKAPIDRDILLSMPNLKVFCALSIGVDLLDFELFHERGVRISNTPDVQSDDCADLVFAHMLNVSRRVIEGSQQLMANPTFYNEQSFTFLGSEVTGTTLGILGMGSIGYKVAERARGFRMKILYHNRRKRCDNEESKVGATYYSKLDDMLRLVDFLVICCPLSPQTKNTMGSREFKLMKSNAMIVNISRGGIVDTEALVDALRNKTIRAAGLDVTNPEPLPKDHPLWTMSNVLITPHIGASTTETRDRMFRLCIDNAMAGIEGRAMSSEIFYHK